MKIFTTTRRAPSSTLFFIILLTTLVVACGGGGNDATPQESRAAQDTRPFIISCSDDCSTIIATVEENNGTVVQQYANVNAFVANISTDQLATITSQPGVINIGKDVSIPLPKPVPERTATIDSSDVGQLSATNVQALGSLFDTPKSYVYDSVLTRSNELHDAGETGENVIVAVIDSGTANNPDIVPALAGSVIGGENFVPNTNEPSATSTLNDDHGTWVGTMIAGHALAVLDNTSPMVEAISTHLPDSIIPVDANQSMVPMIGTAPDAKIYALKIFSANEPGAPRSRTLAALDRVLTLKRNYNAGGASAPIAGDGSEENPFVYDALDIQVVNLSLGGPTLFPGNTVEDALIEQLLAEGVVVIVATGNEGFAAITGGSPGTAPAALSIGAATVPSHERILRDLQRGPGVGIQFRPTDHIQIAEFSSRGPTADGRRGVDIVANGFAVFVQGADGGLSLVSGTSFSAPTVAGAAALLRGSAPSTSAETVRASLIEGANGSLIGGGPSAFDQGTGFLDVARSFTLLQDRSEDDEEENEEESGGAQITPAPKVDGQPLEVATLLENSGITIIDVDEDEPYTASVDLSPGQVRQFFIETTPETGRLSLTVTNISPALPADQQNQIFGDDLMLTVVDAPTSYNETRFFDFLAQDAFIDIENPQEGIMRVAVMGDWTNVGNVSAQISLISQESDLAAPIFTGTLADDQTDEYSFDVPAGLASINFELAWQASWAFYPSHDLDLILITPGGDLIVEGATLDSPERVHIDAPQAGTWTILIDGFQLHDFTDGYSVRITDDAGNTM